MTSYFFNAEEVFHIAIQIEQNGEEFYNLMVKQVADNKTKDVCQRLAGEEHKHRLMFEGLLIELVAKKGSVYNLTEFPESDLAYLKALADTNVFTHKLNTAAFSNPMPSAQNAVKLALDFEKDSILFFLQMKKFTRPEWGQVEIDKLIEQEQEHIRLLTGLLKEIK